MTVRVGVPLAARFALFVAAPAIAQQANMSFFVTSQGPGKGADLGGLASSPPASVSCRRAETFSGTNLARPACPGRSPVASMRGQTR